MAADIPMKGDPRAFEAALSPVREDKLREVREGHDGTWVVHPGLVATAREAFDTVLEGRPNQRDVVLEDVAIGEADLLAVPRGPTTEAGLRRDVGVAIEYFAAWLDGVGCLPIEGRMEDAATAEICRTRVWQLLRHEARTDDGAKVTRARLDALVDETMARLVAGAGRGDTRARLARARALFEAVALDPTQFHDFATVPAYARLVADDAPLPEHRPNDEEEPR